MECYNECASSFFVGCHKHNNSVALGLIQPSSPSTKELHDLHVEVITRPDWVLAPFSLEYLDSLFATGH